MTVASYSRSVLLLYFSGAFKRKEKHHSTPFLLRATISRDAQKNSVRIITALQNYILHRNFFLLIFPKLLYFN